MKWPQRKHLPLFLVFLFILSLIWTQAMLDRPGFSFFQRLEWITSDWRMRMAIRFNQPVSPRLGAVFIDEKTVEDLNSGRLGATYQWPYPRHLHAQVVRELKTQGAQVAGFDVVFDLLRLIVIMEGDERVGTDAVFAREMAKAGNVLIAAEPSVYPNDLFATNAAGVGLIQAEKDRDGVLRRVTPYRDDPNHGRVWNLGILMAAQSLGLDLARAEVHPREILVPSRRKEGPMRIPLDKTGQLEVVWCVRETDPRLVTASYSDLLELDDLRRPGHEAELAKKFQEIRVGRLRRIGLSPIVDNLRKEIMAGTPMFKDRIVVIGSTMVGNNLSDVGATPLEKETHLISVYPNVANQLMEGLFMRPIPLGWVALAMLAPGILSFWISWRARISLTSILVVLLAAAYTAVAVLLYAHERVMIPMVIPILGAIFLTHLYVVSYRVFFEETERRRIRAVFTRIVSPNVVQELLEAESIHLGGARRHVTVLFTDVRGFTELTDSDQSRSQQQIDQLGLKGPAAERMANERAQLLLNTINEYLGAIANVVKWHNGTLDKYIGDCVMAFWGAPTPNPKHARDAVHAAIEAQRVVEQINRKRVEENKRREEENKRRVTRGEAPLEKLPLLFLGTGVNTGDVMVGLMGSEEHLLNYTVFGRDVNLASRLEGVAGRGRIMIGEATYLELQKEDPELARRCVAQQPVMVKGFRETVQCYEVPWKTSTLGGAEAGEETRPEAGGGQSVNCNL